MSSIMGSLTRFENVPELIEIDTLGAGSVAHGFHEIQCDRFDVYVISMFVKPEGLPSEVYVVQLSLEHGLNQDHPSLWLRREFSERIQRARLIIERKIGRKLPDVVGCSGDGTCVACGREMPESAGLKIVTRRGCAEVDENGEVTRWLGNAEGGEFRVRKMEPGRLELDNDFFKLYADRCDWYRKSTTVTPFKEKPT